MATPQDAVPVHVDDAATARVLPFASRLAAGQLLAGALATYQGTGALVLGLGSGGLVVAGSVARALELELDIWLVRELRTSRERDSIGVVAEGPGVHVDRAAVAKAALTYAQVREMIRDAAYANAATRERYRAARPWLDVRARTVILVDDGALTGGTLAAAIAGVRRRGAATIVAAVPVSSMAAVAELRTHIHDLVCLATPPRLRRIASWYQEYRPVDDGAVMRILAAYA